MNESYRDTAVAIGIQGDNRYVGVTPPLSRQEIDALQESGVLQESFEVVRVDEFEPVTTLIKISDHTDSMRSPEGRTARAVYVAEEITRTLDATRSFGVELNDVPVDLEGVNSTPFNPNTDFTR